MEDQFDFSIAKGKKIKTRDDASLYCITVNNSKGPRTFYVFMNPDGTRHVSIGEVKKGGELPGPHVWAWAKEWRDENNKKVVVEVATQNEVAKTSVLIQVINVRPLYGMTQDQMEESADCIEGRVLCFKDKYAKA